MSSFRNKMNKTEFKNYFISDKIFSLKSIRKSMPNFSYRQIDRWEKDSFLLKVKKGFYMFSDQNLNKLFLFFVANKIYSPSYISLETAFKFYGLIPEENFQIVSISSRKTTKLDNVLGFFSYHQVKPQLFFGYRILEGEEKVLMAEIEKAILDYLYLHSELKTEDDFKGMRINKDSFLKNVNFEKLQKYLNLFNNKALEKRVSVFLKTIKND